MDNFKINNRPHPQPLSHWERGVNRKHWRTKNWVRAALLTLCISILVFNSGCAKTVTQIVTYGDQLVVEVTLRGTMDINQNRYFMVLSANSNFQIPLPPPDNIEFEFIEPGMSPQQGSVEAYYTNYYSTWSGYVAVDPGGYFTVMGPFVQGQTVTREVLAGLGDVSSKLVFNFPLSRIFSGTVPDNIYFDFVTVNWPTGGQKIAADHLTSTNAYISKITGSIQTIQDEENPLLAPSQDILSCTVSVQ